MGLHDFLAASLELLALLDTLEQRHKAIAEDIARLHALPAGSAEARTLLVRLRAAHQAAESAIDRVVDLISSF